MRSCKTKVWRRSAPAPPLGARFFWGLSIEAHRYLKVESKGKSKGKSNVEPKVDFNRKTLKAYLATS